MTQENVANTSRAWLLNFGQGLQAAVGYHEMWQILMAPRLFEVPYTPSYCNEILVLQENILLKKVMTICQARSLTILVQYIRKFLKDLRI